MDRLRAETSDASTDLFSEHVSLTGVAVRGGILGSVGSANQRRAEPCGTRSAVALQNDDNRPRPPFVPVLGQAVDRMLQQRLWCFEE